MKSKLIRTIVCLVFLVQFTSVLHAEEESIYDLPLVVSETTVDLPHIPSTPNYSWSPSPEDTRQYIRYEEVPGLCFGQCTSYFVYLFEDEEIVYYGEGINKIKGLRKKHAAESTFAIVSHLIEMNDFNKLANHYQYEDKHCGSEYLTDQGSLKFSVKTQKTNKSVDFDLGCANTKDAETVHKLSRYIRKILPIENLVGKKHYWWGFDKDNAMGQEEMMADYIQQHDKLEARFAPYANTLTTFAQKHNLLIEKYYHDASVWSLNFEHPLGGQAKIDIFIMNTQEIEIQSVRWIDTYSEWTRSLKWGKTTKVIPDNTKLSDALPATLKEILTWKADDWSTVVNNYESIWGKFTEEEFKAMTPKLPKVKP